MPSLDAAGWAGCSRDAAAVAVETAGALAGELRGRLEALRRGAWPGWDEHDVLEDALTAIGTLRSAVAGLVSVTCWAETQARDPEARMDRRAIAGVRTLEELVRRGRGAGDGPAILGAPAPHGCR